MSSSVCAGGEEGIKAPGFGRIEQQIGAWTLDFNSGFTTYHLTALGQITYCGSLPWLSHL